MSEYMRMQLRADLPELQPKIVRCVISSGPGEEEPVCPDPVRHHVEHPPLVKLSEHRTELRLDVDLTL